MTCSDTIGPPKIRLIGIHHTLHTGVLVSTGLCLCSLCCIMWPYGDRQESACAEGKDRQQHSNFCNLSIASTHALAPAAMLEQKETDTNAQKPAECSKRKLIFSEQSSPCTIRDQCQPTCSFNLLKQAGLGPRDCSHRVIRTAPCPSSVYQRSAPCVMGPHLQYSSRLTSTRSFSLSYTMRVNLTWMVL